MSHVAPTARRARGFTLVELLVVIGIIALLISILLPSLNKAREAGNTVKCLSNLRQIGNAIQMYAADNKGALVPSDLRTATGGTADHWATILVGLGFLSYPEVTDRTTPPAFDSVFKCPSGMMDLRGETLSDVGVPDSRQDGRGAGPSLYVSNFLMPGRAVYSWYAPNATSTDDLSIPLHRVPSDNGRVKAPRKLAGILDAASVAILFDGIGSVNMQINNANRLNARHGGKKQTNILMLDGHGETFATETLPGGAGDAGKTPAAAKVTFDPNNNLKKYPYPKWRVNNTSR